MIDAHSGGFSERDFLVFLGARLTPQKRREIITWCTELKVDQSVPESALLAPLQRMEFPRGRKDDLLWVLGESMAGLHELDLHQCLYVCSLFLHLAQRDEYRSACADKALVPALQALLRQPVNHPARGLFRNFLLSTTRRAGPLCPGTPNLNNAGFAALFSVLLLLPPEEGQNTLLFHRILEFLLYHVGFDPGWTPDNFTDTCDDWKSLVQMSLGRGPLGKMLLAVRPGIRPSA